jgi:deoxycytidylate deaminase
MQSLNSALAKALMESTCYKRTVICILLDKDENVVAVESNRCSPPNDQCPRLSLVTTKQNYPANLCNSEHAEVRALKAATKMPAVAYLIGHRFYCDDCERLLKSYGIKLYVMEDYVNS